MAGSVSETITEIRANAAQQHKEARKWRDEYIKETTRLWKEGFAALRQENDQMQRDIKIAFESQIQMNYEWLADEAEGRQK